MTDEKKPKEDVTETPPEESKKEPGEEPQPSPEPEQEEPSAEEPKEEPAPGEEPGAPEQPEEPRETTEKEEEPAETPTEPEKPTEPAEKAEKPPEPVPPKEVKEPPEEKEKKKADFRYIVRIADTDIDGEKTVVHGLTQIKGVGWHMAVLIADAAGLDRNVKIGDLKEPQIEKIIGVLADLNKVAPAWMMNHRKDVDTGNDVHLVSSQVDMRLREDVNVLKMIRSYRGIRHESGLPVRGQRTRANSRRGLSLGVSKKSVRLQQAKKEK